MGVKEDRLRIKQLEKVIGESETKMAIKQEELSTWQSQLSKLKNEYGTLITKLTKDTPKGPNVSDHALLRYLEKTYHLDLDELRGRILTPLCIQAINAGAGSVKVGGMKFKISGKTIVTIVS